MNYENECHICGLAWYTDEPADQCLRCGDYETISNQLLGENKMAELKCKDGTVIEISDETETELRKAFGREPPSYRDSALRISINKSHTWPITIKIARTCTGNKDSVTRDIKSTEAYIKALQEAVDYCKQYNLRL